MKINRDTYQIDKKKIKEYNKRLNSSGTLKIFGFKGASYGFIRKTEKS